MLDEVIRESEVKAMNTNKIKKTKVEKNYRQEANYYFEENGFDYYAALKAYKEDLDVEIQAYQKEKDLKKAKKSKKKVGEEDVATNGCNKGCNIF